MRTVTYAGCWLHDGWQCRTDDLRHDDFWWQVLGWHLSVEASMHPGAHGFGWFFRYLTFYSFSLQFATLGLSCLSDIAREVRDFLVTCRCKVAAV